jgi:uncharacterized protein (DUF433 family)
MPLVKAAMDPSGIITANTESAEGTVVRGLCITEYDVLRYLAAGLMRQEILSDFPYLTDQDTRACLAFAADGELPQSETEKFTITARRFS